MGDEGERCRVARPYKPYRWRWSGADPALALELSEQLGISPVLAQVLVNRGYTTPEAAREFLDPSRERFLDPLLLKDMDRAVDLLRERIAGKKPVLVYGDYDVDGVVATSILVSVLQSLGVPVDYHIPNRFTEGYGLNQTALAQARDRGFDFVLSVDTGISALAEAEAARELGLTLVITDHHEPGPELPRAAAVVNPKRPDCPYPFKGLCGAGVAFKLVQALLGPADPRLDELLELVALATVADLVPLIGENRILVREGLERLSTTRRPGLVALKQVAGLEGDKPVTTGHVGFALAPRLNALGRMGDARAGVELLLTADSDRAMALARFLDAENQARQDVERKILDEALAQVQGQPLADRQYAAVLAGEGWHHGVVGIVASRVVEATYRPAVLLAIEGDQARGSARSIPGFHLYRALYECRDLLEKFGGHAMAAGMTLKAENIPALRERLNRLVREWLTDDDLVPELAVDSLVPPEQITPGLVAELAQLEPHGLGNPGPRLVTGGEVVESRGVGQDGSHLKLRLRAGGQVLDGIGFGLAALGAPGAMLPPAPAPVQVAFTPEINRWNGSERLQLVVRDLQVAPARGPARDSAPGPARGSARGPAPVPPIAGYESLSLNRLLAWDPLAGLEAVPASGPLPAWQPLAAVADAAAVRPETAAREVAAAGEPPALASHPATEETPEAATAEEPPDQEHALAPVALLARTGWVLVLVASPWAIPPLVAGLRPLVLPEGGEVAAWWPGEPCPADRPERTQVVVAPWGQPLPAGDFRAVVAWHPPYHLGQAVAAAQALVGPGGLYAGWRPENWRLLARTLSWPYPDRPELVQVYRLLRDHGGGRSLAEWAALLAARSREPLGPWNSLRIRAALQVFEELGLATGLAKDFAHLLSAGAAMHGKMNLSESPRYRRGQAGRSSLDRCRDALHGAPGV